MICATNVTLAYGKRVLFKDVNIKFTPGNCYGLIGANGSGKSTFLKILAGEIEPDAGTVFTGPRERIAVLRQDQFAFDEETVLNTVIMGHERLYRTMAERDALYARPDFSEEDGIRSSELEIEFEEMNGYEAESEAAVLLKNLMIPEEMHQKTMKNLEGGETVRCMLSRMMLADSNVLIMDEPTNHLDLESITSLNDSLIKFREVILFTSHDHEFVNTLANRVIEIAPGGVIDRLMTFDEYLESTEVANAREALIRKAA